MPRNSQKILSLQRFAASLWMRAADAKNRRYRKAAAKQALSNNQGCRKAEIRPIEPDAGNAAEGRFPIFYSFRFPLIKTDQIPQGLTPCAKFSHTAANGYKQVPASAA